MKSFRGDRMAIGWARLAALAAGFVGWTLLLSGLSLDVARAETPSGGTIVSGTVTGISDAPVADVMLELRLVQPNGLYTVVAHGATDGEGKYSLEDVPPGAYSLLVWTGANHANPDPIYLKVGTDPVVRDIELEPGATISGLAIDTDGRPLQGVGVSALRLTDGVVAGGTNSYATTTADGSFLLTKIPSGQFTLEFRKNGYVVERWDDKPAYLQPNSFDVATGARLIGKNATLCRAATITGTVTVEGQEPDPFVEVWARRFDERDGRWHELATTPGGGVVRSGTYGQYLVDQLPPGEYQLCFHPVPGRALLGCWGPDAAAEPVTFTVAEGETVVKNMTLLRGNWPFVSAPVPTVEGDATSGSILVAARGNWEPLPDGFVYEWRRGEVSLGQTTSSTYELTATDVGQRISVAITGYRYGYTTTKMVSAPTAPVTATSPPMSIPKRLTKTTTPRISGTVKVGKKLTAKPGTWMPQVAFSYQWYRSGKAIAGASEPTYRVQPLDKAKRLTVQVTGSREGYANASRASKPTPKAAAGTLTSAKPRILGSAKVGYTLEAVPGAWKPTEAKLSFQWYRSGKKIRGATLSSYLVVPRDKGKKLTVKVTGKAVGYTGKYATSSATRKIR